MAIVNRTPDSFYDRGATFGFDVALRARATRRGRGCRDRRHRRRQGCTGRRGNTGRRDRAHRRRSSRAVRDEFPDLVISVDTWRAEVGAAACDAGADLLNDAWGGWDPTSPPVAAQHDAALVCTHAGGVEPRTRPHRVEYDDVMADVLAAHGGAGRAGRGAGRRRETRAHRPGPRLRQEHPALARGHPPPGEMVATGWPVLVSLSNKDFVGETLDRPVGERWSAHWRRHRCQRVARAHACSAPTTSPRRGRRCDMVASIAGTRAPARTVRGLA